MVPYFGWLFLHEPATPKHWKGRNWKWAWLSWRIIIPSYFLTSSEGLGTEFWRLGEMEGGFIASKVLGRKWWGDAGGGWNIISLPFHTDFNGSTLVLIFLSFFRGQESLRLHTKEVWPNHFVRVIILIWEWPPLRLSSRDYFFCPSTISCRQCWQHSIEPSISLMSTHFPFPDSAIWRCSCRFLSHSCLLNLSPL